MRNFLKFLLAGVLLGAFVGICINYYRINYTSEGVKYWNNMAANFEEGAKEFRTKALEMEKLYK